MNIVIPQNVTPVTAKRWYLQLLMDFGPGFHPDTDADDYINYSTGEKSFNDEQVAQLNNSVDKIFELLNDPYDIGLGIVLNQIYGYYE